MIYAKSKDKEVGEGGGDLTSIVKLELDSSPLEIVFNFPFLPPPPPPTLTFFVTITYIKELRGFLLLVVFIYSLIQNRLYEIVGHFTVFRTLPLLVQF